jgi:hypothetical protein
MMDLPRLQCRVVIRSRALRSLPHGNFKAGIVKTLFIDDIVKRAGLFLVALVVWALATLAGQTVYEGLVTGCVKVLRGDEGETAASIKMRLRLGLSA